MSERPILFSAPMVRAILDGRKTQTRRALRNQPVELPDFNRGRLSIRIGGGKYRAWHPDMPGIPCPYGKPGDRLWVRETWALHDQGFDTAEESGFPIYQADSPHTPKRWRPSIHMPRELCRLRLEVVRVRVERLHALSRADAAAEGICYPDDEPKPEWYHNSNWPEENFAGLWDAINGAGAWAANPWVWVITFRRVQ